jgi:capsular polysaccharide transport system permease protein
LSDLTTIETPRTLSLVDAKARSDAISRALRRAARQSRQPAPLIVGGGGVRARKGDRVFRLALIMSFLFMAALPAIAATIYWGFIASKQYESEAKFTLRSGEASPLDSLGGFAGLPSSRQAQDTQILANYVRSPAIISELEKSLDLKAIFGRPEVDDFSRLKPDASIEDVEKYWRKRVNVGVETASSIVTLDVRAFTPEDSELLAKKIVELSEKLVNGITNRPRHDALAFSEAELKRSEENLRQASAAMRDARNAQGVIDAGASAEGINKVLTILRLQLAEAESDLAARGPEALQAPQSRVQKAQIAALKQQIAEYSSQIAGNSAEHGANMADRLSTLSGVQTSLDLARQQYAEASVAFQSARVDLEAQHTYLVAFLQPVLAQKSTYPRRWLEWLIFVGPCVLIWSLFAGLAFQARDNMAK